MEELELTKLFFKTVKVEVDKAKNHANYDPLKENYSLISEKGKYLMNIQNHYVSLGDLKEDLKKTEVFLRRYPYRTYLRENGINEISYIQYHLEVFIHKLSSIRDIFLLLINNVYELHIPEKLCSWNKISKRDEVQNSYVLSIASNYYKTFKDLILARNLNTHRAIFKDEQLDRFRLPLMIYDYHRQKNIPIDEKLTEDIPEFYINSHVSAIRKEKVKFIRNSIQAVEYYCNQFTDFAFIEALTRYKKY